MAIGFTATFTMPTKIAGIFLMMPKNGGMVTSMI
jgi:hypothetical protein